MARLRDIGHVWTNVGPWTFVKRLYNQTYCDNLLVWAAALAYSWLFALFPLLIFCLSLIPLLPERAGGLPLKPPREQIEKFIDAALVTGEDPVEAAEKVDEANENPREVVEQVQVPLAPTTQNVTTQPADVKP